jgi:hypothetical protein
MYWFDGGDAMKKLFLVLLVVGIVGCSAGNDVDSAQAPAPEEDVAPKVTDTVQSLGGLFLGLSSPNEAFQALAETTSPDDWVRFLDESTAISDRGRVATGFDIGVRGANALLAIAVGDVDLATSLAESVQRAANGLDISSDRLERLGTQLQEALQIEDETDREVHVSRSLNALRGELVQLLNTIDEVEVALAIEFGAWIEGVRQSSGIVRDNYTEQLALTLGRANEAVYFVRALETLRAREESDTFTALIEPMAQMAELMDVGASVMTAAQVTTLHLLSTNLRDRAAAI